MEFGYFTLSDNHYPNNPRSANQFVLDIREQALLADKIGMHSAWIGEHHFDSLGVNSRPDLLLANIASQTKNIRLANKFVLDIREQALLADKIGMHSAWIGEHHFDSR